jgi:DNA-binding transcriptional MerR regulator
VLDVKEIISSIKTRGRQLSKIVKLLDSYEKACSDPVDNAYIIEKKISELEKNIAALSDRDERDVLKNWLDSAKNSVSKLKDDFRFKFGQQLKNLFGKDGQKIRGQYPLLRIGFFTLKLNFEFGDATLFFGPEIERLRSKIPLQPKAIYDAIRQYEQSIRETNFDASRTFEDLYEAYKRCLIVAGKSSGDKIWITEVLKEYVFSKQSKQFMIDPSKEHFHGYPRAKLSYMLYRLKHANATERGLRLHVATFDATVDKSRSFWVPDNEEGEGTHYEYMSFEVRHE